MSACASTRTVEQIAWLRQEFGTRGLGGLAFARPVDGAALKDFLVILARPVENEEDASKLRDSLNQMKDLALEMLGPRSFGDEGTVDEIRIDKKTFALQTYAKSVVAARECVAAMKSGADPLSTRLPVTRIIQDLIDIATERVNLLLKMCAIPSRPTSTSTTTPPTPRCCPSSSARRCRSSGCGWSIPGGSVPGGFRLRALAPGARRPSFEVSAMLSATSWWRPWSDDRVLIGAGRITDSVVRRVLVAYEHHHPYLDPVTQEPARLQPPHRRGGGCLRRAHDPSALARRLQPR